jgi:hypothetical protein
MHGLLHHSLLFVGGLGLRKMENPYAALSHGSVGELLILVSCFC